MRKKNLFLGIAVGVTTLCSATVLTVSNNTSVPGSPGTFSSVVSAITAASTGDTLLLQPSPINYGNFTIANKGLCIIGAGYNPQTASGLPTQVGVVTFGNGSSNSRLMGLYFLVSGVSTSFGLNFNNTFAVSNFTVSRCYFAGGGNLTYRIDFFSSAAVSNCLVENCVVAGVIRVTSSCIIRNNIFHSGAIHAPTNNTVTHFIRNNAFVGSNLSFFTINNSVIENNIIFTPGTISFPNSGNNTFNNNYVNGTLTLPFGSNVGSGNITNLSQTFPAYVPGGGISFTVDLRPIVTSACINGGTDGTDIGITGGVSPFYLYPSPYPMTGEPPIPQVHEILLPVSSVPYGGTLNLSIKARKRD